MIDKSLLARAQGCLLGQLAGDSLGSLVEFQSPETIKAAYPARVRQLKGGGTWNTLAGQPTDDSEMALVLARQLLADGTYDAKAVLRGYKAWLESDPFDCGTTIRRALGGIKTPESQANGAMMRISPLGIFGANKSLAQVADWARQDAALTHANALVQEANALFAMAIAHAIATGCGAQELYNQIAKWAQQLSVAPALTQVIDRAASTVPHDYCENMGWVILAFQNALYHLYNTRSLEEALVFTVGQGGDTDTNAAICGALLGAVYGREAIPQQWQEAVLSCRPERRHGVVHPRPSTYWPVDALDLAAALLQ